jgi:hypothetical protein
MSRHHPQSARTTSARSLAILGLFVLALAISACGSGAEIFANVGDNLQGGNPAPGDDAGGGGGGDGEQPASLADRRIIKTGEITVEVTNVAAAVGRVRALALELDGYVGNSQSGAFGEGAALTLRIPADRFDDALARVRALDGDVLFEATREEDVTSAIVDLEARLKNLQASEVQYRALLTQAVKIEDILSVQTRLDDVRGQIEQLQAQDKELTGLADLATLTVSLVPGAVQQASGNWDPGKTVTDAYAALVGVGQSVANGAIWFAIVWLPALVVLAIVVLLVMRFVPGLRPRRGGGPEPE